MIQKSKVTGQMNRRYCISCASSSCFLLTCLAVCAGSTASSPCTRPPSPPSQVGSCAPAESPFSTQDDCPYSEGDTWTDKRLESDRTWTTAFVCVCFYSGSTWLTPQHPQRGTPPLGRSNRECGSLDTCLLTEQRISRWIQTQDVFALRGLVALGGQRTKILGELLRVERGAHQDDLEVVSDIQQILHDGEQNVRLQVSLVDLVQHQVAHAGQQSAAQTTMKRKNKQLVRLQSGQILCNVKSSVLMNTERHILGSSGQTKGNKGVCWHFYSNDLRIWLIRESQLRP